MEILKLIFYILTGATALVGSIALYAYLRAALRDELPQDAMDNDNWYKK